ncbi:IS21-like element helper ATPase IstB [Microbacterium kribbense]|uniref:IS21-like element helper ATPase IstB n=1 Tax=Microbacterium kribbense TaxID=433645 RepID=A0ABP7GXC8_9MICO
MTGASVQEIIDEGRNVPLTGSILADWARRGTPKQRDYLLGLLTAEHASRQHSRRVRLLKAAGLPALKSLDGYDWGAIRFPDGFDRHQLAGLAWEDDGEDLVCYGDVGTGKTHLACALTAATCQAGDPARYFTASSLIAHLRDASHAGRLDRALAAIARNRLVAIDELGYLPIDPEGARLLFQVISNAYEHHSLIITTNLEFSRWGAVFGDDTMAAAIIDRLVHHGRLLHFHGDSWRVQHALMA